MIRKIRYWLIRKLAGNSVAHAPFVPCPSCNTRLRFVTFRRDHIQHLMLQPLEYRSLKSNSGSDYKVSNNP